MQCGFETQDNTTACNVQFWVGSSVLTDMIRSVAKLEISLWIKGIWELLVLLYKFLVD